RGGGERVRTGARRTTGGGGRARDDPRRARRADGAAAPRGGHPRGRGHLEVAGDDRRRFRREHLTGPLRRKAHVCPPPAIPAPTTTARSPPVRFTAKYLPAAGV